MTNTEVQLLTSKFFSDDADVRDEAADEISYQLFEELHSSRCTPVPVLRELASTLKEAIQRETESTPRASLLDALYQCLFQVIKEDEAVDLGWLRPLLNRAEGEEMACILDLLEFDREAWSEQVLRESTDSQVVDIAESASSALKRRESRRRGK